MTVRYIEQHEIQEVLRTEAKLKELKADIVTKLKRGYRPTRGNLTVAYAPATEPREKIPHDKVLAAVTGVNPEFDEIINAAIADLKTVTRKTNKLHIGETEPVTELVEENDRCWACFEHEVVDGDYAEYIEHIDHFPFADEEEEAV